MGKSGIKSGKDVAFIYCSHIWAIAVPVIREYLQFSLKGIATFLYYRIAGWIGYVQLFGDFSGSLAVLRYVYCLVNNEAAYFMYFSRKRRDMLYPVIILLQASFFDIHTSVHRNILL